jgi:hypothetical protein
MQCLKKFAYEADDEERNGLRAKLKKEENEISRYWNFKPSADS